MSYEGYDQLLCENGHYHTRDAYDGYHADLWRCPTCGSKLAWCNSVDLTNCCPGRDFCSYDGPCSYPGQGSGYIKLVVDVPAKECKCSECGHVHGKTEATYKIPKNVGHLLEKS